MRKARHGEIKACWDAVEKDMGWAWGEGTAKADGNLVGVTLFLDKCIGGLDGRTLSQELEARGYDLKTLQFSIRKKRK